MSDRPILLSLAGLLGTSSLNDEELATLRKRAWVEQGLLIVHPWDRRLKNHEAKLIRDIAERLYGGDA